MASTAAPDGRWEAKAFVDTPDGRRKRISVYGDTERKVLNELNNIRDHQRRGIPVATTTLTVAEYMTYWLEHIAEPGIRRTTYATYEGDVRLHIVPGIGKRKLKTLQARPHSDMAERSSDEVPVPRQRQGRREKDPPMLCNG